MSTGATSSAQSLCTLTQSTTTAPTFFCMPGVVRAHSGTRTHSANTHGILNSDKSLKAQTPSGFGISDWSSAEPSSDHWEPLTQPDPSHVLDQTATDLMHQIGSRRNYLPSNGCGHTQPGNRPGSWLHIGLCNENRLQITCWEDLGRHAIHRRGVLPPVQVAQGYPSAHRMAR